MAAVDNQNCSRKSTYHIIWLDGSVAVVGKCICCYRSALGCVVRLDSDVISENIPYLRRCHSSERRPSAMGDSFSLDNRHVFTASPSGDVSSTAKVGRVKCEVVKKDRSLAILLGVFACETNPHKTITSYDDNRTKRARGRHRNTSSRQGQQVGHPSRERSVDTFT